MKAEEAIERLSGRRMAVSMCVSVEDCKKENEAIDLAIEALGSIRHGRWIPHHSGGCSCSACNRWTPFSHGTKYCENCGAKMDSKEQSGLVT